MFYYRGLTGNTFGMIEMKYEIKGTPFPVVTCFLEKGETMVTEKGAMSWMTDQMKMETNTGGGLMSGLGRMFSGDSIFLNNYTAEGDGQFITFGSSFPGRILDFHLENGKMIIAQKDAFLAMEKSVELSIHFKKKSVAVSSAAKVSSCKNSPVTVMSFWKSTVILLNTNSKPASGYSLIRVIWPPWKIPFNSM